MPDPKRVIELEPKNPFRWTVFSAMLVLWVIVLALAIWLKSSVLRMLLPVILLILVVYLGTCTLLLLKNRK